MKNLTIEMSALVSEFALKILATNPTPKQLQEILSKTLQTVETNGVLTLQNRK